MLMYSIFFSLTIKKLISILRNKSVVVETLLQFFVGKPLPVFVENPIALIPSSDPVKKQRFKWWGLSVDITILAQMGCLPLPRLYTCIKSWKNVHTVRRQRYFLKHASSDQSIRPFCFHIKIVPKGCLPLSWGYTCMKKKISYKIMRQKGNFLELVLNDGNNKSFKMLPELITSGCMPMPWGYKKLQNPSPCPGPGECYRTIGVYFQMADHFCNSVGVLQQFAPPSPFPGFDKQGGKTPVPQPTEGNTVLLSYRIRYEVSDRKDWANSVDTDQTGAVWSGSTLLPLVCIFWTSYSVVNWYWSNFRTLTSTFSAVQTFKIFTIDFLVRHWRSVEPAHEIIVLIA